MADYTANIIIGERVVPFNLNGAVSVHLAKHTLIYVVRRVGLLTKEKVKAEIVRWDWVEDGDCVSKDPEVIFSI
jgi:hypothetical protein